MIHPYAVVAMVNQQPTALRQVAKQARAGNAYMLFTRTRVNLGYLGYTVELEVTKV